LQQVGFVVASRARGAVVRTVLGNLISRRTRRARSATCHFRNTSLRSAAVFVRGMHPSDSRKSAGSQSFTAEARPFDSTSALFFGCKMWADPKYLRSWRDLRRRDLLFWFFVLSYVPGILLIIVVVNVLDHDAPEHIGIYFSAAWLAGFVGTSLYRQNFRCPRCHQFFFRRYMLVDPYSRNCVHCNLACWAGKP
jgi:hypothetical protein